MGILLRCIFWKY